MTCRPDSDVPENYKGTRFQTVCYKCGRPMYWIKGQRFQDNKWIDEWLIDEEIFTDAGLSMAFNSPKTLKISKEDDDFIHKEIEKYDKKMKAIFA
jgi:hypothetical protein